MECMGFFGPPRGPGPLPTWVCPEHGSDHMPEHFRLRQLLRMESGLPLAEPEQDEAEN